MPLIFYTLIRSVLYFICVKVYMFHNIYAWLTIIDHGGQLLTIIDYV
jgi:hypothetical protein